MYIVFLIFGIGKANIGGEKTFPMIVLKVFSSSLLIG